MAIEFIRMKLWLNDGSTVLLSGSAVLHPDGAMDLFGDAACYGHEIASAVERFDVESPMAEQRLLVEPLPRGSVRFDKVRWGTTDSLTPVTLAPGRAATIAPGAPPAVKDALRADLTSFRAVRAAALPLAA
ncbi:hypothetical protein [Azospirillum sp.]|uniref:hypothetical protein n=1 Tax=Azospirillum sp. TaxID=34012 RepID=UPI003D70C552